MRGAGFAVLRARRHRHRLSLHRDLRHVDHADRQPGVLRAGRAITDAQAVPKMAEMLGTLLGHVRRLRLLGGLLGGGVRVAARACGRACRISTPTSTASSRSYAGDARREVTKVTSTPYRLALLFITLVPLPFAFTGRPILVIVTYTIVGSLFVPFLAATLLYLNNQRGGGGENRAKRPPIGGPGRNRRENPKPARGILPAGPAGALCPPPPGPGAQAGGGARTTFSGAFGESWGGRGRGRGGISAGRRAFCWSSGGEKKSLRPERQPGALRGRRCPPPAEFGPVHARRRTPARAGHGLRGRPPAQDDGARLADGDEADRPLGNRGAGVHPVRPDGAHGAPDDSVVGGLRAVVLRPGAPVSHPMGRCSTSSDLKS